MMNKFLHVNDSTSSIEYIESIFNQLDLNPPYQREGSIWSLEKKQLFIDSLINGFDVPKFYFCRVDRGAAEDQQHQHIRYDIVDGKQRLETIHGFLNDEFRLSKNIRYFDNTDYDLGDLCFSELRERYRDIAFGLTSYRLDIIVLDHLEERLIDEFFVRLNEGVALNAQEKRNATSCHLSGRVRFVAHNSDFATKCLRKKARYKNDEIVAKFFSIVEQYTKNSRVLDTKKSRLDLMYRRSDERTLSDSDVDVIESKVTSVMRCLQKVFDEEDPLLYSVGSVSVYFVSALINPHLWEAPGCRDLLSEFEHLRRTIVKADLTTLNESDQQIFEILDDYNGRVQSANDGSAIMFRSNCINAFLSAGGNSEDFIREFLESASSNTHPAPAKLKTVRE